MMTHKKQLVCTIMRKFIFRLLCSSFIFIFFSTAIAGTTQYIIDTDMGFDDWLAVLYLLKQPVQIDAITIDCQGETFCPEGAFNAAELTHLAKRAVPIALGESRPKSNYDFPMLIRHFATSMSVSDFNFLNQDRDIVKQSAAQIIFHSVITAAKNHQRVAIISIGTATNIADAWKLAVAENKTAEFKQGLGMIYKGGGAFGKVIDHHLTNESIPGNISIPGIVDSKNTSAEWNIYANAPAMQTVLSAKLPVTFIPDNASDEVTMTQAIYNTLYNSSTPGSPKRFVANAMDATVSLQGGWKHIASNLDFWDTSTTIAALHPNIVMAKFSNVPVSVILQTGNQYGETMVDAKNTKDAKDAVTVDYQLHKKLFYQLMENGLSQ